MWNGEELTLKPGQLITGMLKTTKLIPTCSAKKWRNSLGILTRAHRIKTKPTRRYTLITVVNYEMYQKEKTVENGEKGTLRAHRRHTEGTLKATEKHLKHLNNLKKKALVSKETKLTYSQFLKSSIANKKNKRGKMLVSKLQKGIKTMRTGDPGFKAREANRQLVLKERAEKEKKSKKQEETKTKKK